jgi:hypothetical protein
MAIIPAVHEANRSTPEIHDAGRQALP